MTSNTPMCLQSILSRYHDDSSLTNFIKHDEILQIIILLPVYDSENYCKTHECSRVWNSPGSIFSSDSKYSELYSLEKTLYSPNAWEKPYYKFALKEELLSLSKSEKVRRNIKTINVTVTPHCLSTGHDHGKHPSITSRAAEMLLSFFSGFVVYDTILLNEVVRNGLYSNHSNNWRYIHFKHVRMYNVGHAHSLLSF